MTIITKYGNIYIRGLEDLGTMKEGKMDIKDVKLVQDQNGTMYALWLEDDNLAFLGMPVCLSMMGAQIRAHFIMGRTKWKRTNIRRDIDTKYGWRLGVAYKIPEGVENPIEVMQLAVAERGTLKPDDDQDWQLTNLEEE